MKLHKFIPISLLIPLFLSCSDSKDQKGRFIHDMDPTVERTWLGPDFWANPLQDWRMANNRIECLVTAPNRNVHLLTMELNGQKAGLKISADLGLAVSSAPLASGWVGFRVGAKGQFDDYRDSAVRGTGLNVGITTEGRLFIGETESEAIPNTDLENGLNLAFEVMPEQDAPMATLSVYGKKKALLGALETELDNFGQLQGNIALVSHFDNTEKPGEQKTGFWFSNFSISGEGVEEHPERAFGPVLFTQHTLSKGTMKLTAQMPPIGKMDSKEVSLLTQDANGKWYEADIAQIDDMSRTATFKVTDWEDQRNVPFKLSYNFSYNGKEIKTYDYEGLIRKDPKDKNEIVVAAFTGNNDLGFPNNEIVEHVLAQKPDLLVFTGDQVYEPVGGYGHIEEPLDLAVLDYLRKWYIYGWAYDKMFREIPVVAIPDDHDVYHGNIWGEGGKAAKKEGSVKERQDDGGYKMPPSWVNMVERTQTSHLPDPFDPTPVKQGIGVYYTDLNVGGISFAILEDRKWKTSPANVFPKEYKVINGWPENPKYNKPEDFLAPDAQLLGERQMNFLNEWVEDWTYGTIMKSVISQSIFSTVATLPDSALSDVVVPTLRITKAGEYPENDRPTQDMDSHGWPSHARDDAIKVMRKAFAFHIAGDQHLATTIQYGVDEWGDAGYAICVPSISNIFPRRWFPRQGGMNRQPDAPKYTGDFHDGFGNKMTVLAVANPEYTGLEPSRLYDRSTGYGIIKFNKKEREISIANWPRQENPQKADAKPYSGWPVIIKQEDNYGRQPKAWLPALTFEGLAMPPVVRIYHDKTGDLVYAIRAHEFTFKPWVFEKGSYRIETGEPGTADWRVLNNINSIDPESSDVIEITF
ncbi:MAG: alkaline phosphatase D family protein [Cyclobacteriaceae bacterium]|nr:alkaline phosphatase D family protein [Cyclobacteriaceae bacterium]